MKGGQYDITKVRYSAHIADYPNSDYIPLTNFKSLSLKM